MPQDKPPKHTAITIFITSKAKVTQIRKLSHMLGEDGLPRSTPLVMDEVLDFYIEAHRKGRKHERNI